MFHRTGRTKRIQHPLASQLYSYQLGRRFDAGAEAEAFEPLFDLPLQVFRGAGRLVGSMNVIQPPQIYVDKTITAAGLGGLVAGQYILQPLQVGDNQTGT